MDAWSIHGGAMLELLQVFGLNIGVFHGVCILSLSMCEFSLGTLASSHSRKTLPLRLKNISPPVTAGDNHHFNIINIYYLSFFSHFKIHSYSQSNITVSLYSEILFALQELILHS